MLIFEFNGKNNGSYIDSVSGNVGTPSGGGEFVRSEKGVAWRGNGVDSGLIYTKTISNNSYDIEMWIKYNDLSSGNYLLDFRDGSGDGQGYSYYLSGEIVISSGSAYTNGEEDSAPIVPNAYEWIHFIFTGVTIDSTTINIGKRYSATDWRVNGDIGRIQIFDHVLTEQERSQLYQEFLRATPTNKIIR